MCRTCPCSVNTIRQPIQHYHSRPSEEAGFQATGSTPLIGVDLTNNGRRTLCTLYIVFNRLYVLGGEAVSYQERGAYHDHDDDNDASDEYDDDHHTLIIDMQMFSD